MRYGVTFNSIGQVLPQGLHIPRNLANFPYVPHPLQLMGHVPLTPTLGFENNAGSGPTASALLGTQLGQRGIR